MRNPVVKAGHKLLELPLCYDLFQSAVGSVNFRTKFVRDNTSNFNFSSVLDLGCGTASTIRLIPNDIQYVGIDTSKEYLAKAKNRSRNLNPTLINSSIGDNAWVSQTNLKGETLSLALGIFHHINDQQLENTLSNLSESLKVGSKVVSLDPIVDDETTGLASWFARNDRGRYLRTAETYFNNFEKAGFRMEFEVQRNKFRIPYDLILMSAVKIG
jgi:SAM-dependent methyltransferase